MSLTENRHLLRELPAAATRLQPGATQRLSLNPARICRKLLFCATAFLLIHITVYIARAQYPPNYRPTALLHKFFSLNVEGNFPTLFSTGLLLLAALLLLVIYRLHPPATAYRRHWIALSGVFFFLAMDEGVGLHDELVYTVRTRLTNDLGGLLHEGWVVPYFGLVLVVGFYFLRFVLHLPPRTRRLFIAAGALFVGAALGFELLEGREVKYAGKSLYFRVLNASEEYFEMSAVILFIYTLLDYMGPAQVKLQARFDRFRASAPGAGSSAATVGNVD